MVADGMLMDEELGRLWVRVNARARRYTFRTREEGIIVTVPPGTTDAEIRKAVEQLRPRLRTAQLWLQPKPLIDLQYRLDAELFHLSLVGGQTGRFLLRKEPGGIQIVCPPDTDFANEELQAWLRKVIEEALKRRAQEVLPPRLQELSARHKLPYRSVKISSSTGRWGSCSARGSINLSYFLMLLPCHLMDYVMLHELAHTREMNHGERFWALLDKMTDGRSHALRDELKSYRTEI